jgi:hypothetical protein
MTVEQCLRFDIGSLKEALKGVDVPNNRGDVVSGATIRWSNTYGGIEAVVGYQLGRIKGEGLLVLIDPELTREFSDAVRLQADYIIPIDATPTHIGGVRYWFRCPMEHNGKPCGRRVKKLYLPSGEQVFGCRQCYDLTYRSVQTHDKRRNALARNPDALDAALSSPDLRQAFLGIQALPLHVRQMQKRGWW